ncbi:uncharacterized protein LOC111625241 [Centruroides sculpturatus]|uniref:uncharacterized protein LOC111625241 n=1 Tax=Centruroides sculpturatus TaxID=218467 RepID=UPI000C6EAAFC|nr:uncharacterized protein LOC111625241 [Centruroides sculpturatus]
MNLSIRLFMATLVLQMLSFTLLVSWRTATLTSIIYDNFISVEKYFSDPLTLTYKLKVVCFMKIFGGMPIGISIGIFLRETELLDSSKISVVFAKSSLYIV